MAAALETLSSNRNRQNHGHFWTCPVTDEIGGCGWFLGRAWTAPPDGGSYANSLRHLTASKAFRFGFSFVVIG
jgi:hypothetical protein